MNHLRILFLAFLTLAAFAANSQTTDAVTIKGKLLAEKGKEPVAGATVSLLSATDSSAVQKTVTDAGGLFSFKTPAGTYVVKIDMIGHTTRVLQTMTIRGDTILAPVLPAGDVKQLDAITVSAVKSDVELKTDRKVFNVGSDIVSKGGSANDILNNVPSVNVDVQGNVTLRGNGSVRILINGKPSMLTANNGLRQIPAATIEKVEVITNPSSAYEAEGGGGIINIILKKNSQYGFNASLQAGLGSPANNSVNVNASYKTKKVNLFSNIGYRYMEFFGKDRISRINTNNGKASTLRQENNEKYRLGSVNFYLGGDYYINDRNTLTGSYNHIHRVNKVKTQYAYNYFGDANQPDSSISRAENYREPQIFNEIELNYVKTFAKKGRKWTTNMQYDFWNDDENQQITQRTIYPQSGPVSNLVSRDIESSNDVFIQSDYVTPLKKEARLEMGVRASLRAISSDYKATQDDVILEPYDNKLNYDENIYGAYIQYANKIKKISYQAGLRSEWSNIHIEDRTKTVDKRKSYIDFFPTLHLQYSLEHNFDLQLSYSRRINRPKFWQLNTFGGLSDTRYLTTGNADLDPMYTNSFELGALKKIGKLSINPALYYQHSTGYFDYILEQTADGYFVRTPVNLATEKRYGAELSAAYSPFNWWRLSMDFNFYKFTQKGGYKGRSYDVEAQTWFTTFRSGIKLPKIISFDFSLNYRGENKNVQSVTKRQYRANTGVSKDFWGDKLTLSFSVNNLFDSQIEQTITTTNSYSLDYYSQGNPRQYTGSLIYRFKRSKEQKDRLPGEM